MPVEDWEEEPSYKNGKSVVSHLCVVNDAAERGVKLCFDFFKAAKHEEGIQNVLQVVENCRCACQTSASESWSQSAGF